jgi:hypothetical protein
MAPEGETTGDPVQHHETVMFVPHHRPMPPHEQAEEQRHNGITHSKPGFPEDRPDSGMAGPRVADGLLLQKTVRRLWPGPDQKSNSRLAEKVRGGASQAELAPALPIRFPLATEA